jgi:hypothetical protein
MKVFKRTLTVGDVATFGKELDTSRLTELAVAELNKYKTQQKASRKALNRAYGAKTLDELAEALRVYGESCHDASLDGSQVLVRTKDGKWIMEVRLCAGDPIEKLTEMAKKINFPCIKTSDFSADNNKALGIKGIKPKPVPVKEQKSTMKKLTKMFLTDYQKRLKKEQKMLAKTARSVPFRGVTR